MKTILVLAIVSLAFLTNCATKQPTAEERIASVGQSYEEADKQIENAERNLASFESSIADLRETAAESKNMRTKAAYDETLARLNGRLQQTHADLQFLKAANNRGRVEYQNQLEAAASQIQHSADENKSSE